MLRLSMPFRNSSDMLGSLALGGAGPTCRGTPCGYTAARVLEETMDDGVSDLSTVDPVSTILVMVANSPEK